MRYSKIIADKKSLYEWMKENTKDGFLSDELQDKLPDFETKDLSYPELSHINMAAGMLDTIVGGGGEESEETARNLLALIEQVKSVGKEENDELLGEIYDFLIHQNVATYISDFATLVFTDDEGRNDRLNSCLGTAFIFAKEAVHREVVKFCIAIMGIFHIPESTEDIFMTFGLADEFAHFVALSLANQEQNGSLFSLAKRTHGYGRINYIKYLQPTNDEMKSWLLFEGYKCDVGTQHVALECAKKGDLLGFIKTNGWDEKLYHSCEEILLGLVDYNDAIFDYDDAKEVIELFLDEAKDKDLSIENFYVLCELSYYIDRGYKELKIDEKEKENFIDIIRFCAWEKGVDWKEIVSKNLTNFKARAIAKTLGFNIWEQLFDLAKNDESFSDWYTLAQTKDKENYKKLCALAEAKLPLAQIASGPEDELGLDREFDLHTNLSILVQNLANFDEIIGLNLVATALSSPVTNNRNTALKVVDSWKSVPKQIIDILRENLPIEPHEDAVKMYKKILQNHTVENLLVDYKSIETQNIDMTFYGKKGSLSFHIDEVLFSFNEWVKAIECLCEGGYPTFVIESKDGLFRLDIFKTDGDCIFKIFEHRTNELLFITSASIEQIIEQMFTKMVDFTNENCPFWHTIPIPEYKSKIIESYPNQYEENPPGIAECRYCNQTIEVKTIDNMLKRAYDIIDSDEKITKLLEDLRLDKYNVGISQEHSRLAKIGLPNWTNMPVYRCVQEHESGIYLCFNENFTQLEKIEIQERIFREGDIRGYRVQFNTWTHEEKINFLDKAFSNFDASLKGLNSIVKIKVAEYPIDNKIALKKPDDSYRCVYFPNTDTFPYLTFNLDEHFSDGTLESIDLNLCYNTPIDEPLSEWLHQKIYTIFPDYAGTYFWKGSSNADLGSLKGYDLENSEIKKEIENWQSLFELDTENLDFDWEGFNKIGYKLFLKLRDLVKNDYIITYAKSIDETCGTHAEYEAGLIKH